MLLLVFGKACSLFENVSFRFFFSFSQELRRLTVFFFCEVVAVRAF